jgi:WD40 repeat protein
MAPRKPWPRALVLALVATAGCRADEPPSTDSAGTRCATCGRRGEPRCARSLVPAEPCLVTLATYEGATDLSISGAWSPNDDRVLSGGNGELRLLEIVGEPPSFRELDVREHPGRTSVAWSPDGRFVLAASHDVRLFSIDRGSLVPLGAPYAGHAGEIYALAWSPEGARALTVGEDGVARLLEIDTARGALDLLGTFDVGPGKIYDVAFAPNGAFAAIGTESGSLVVLSVAAGGALDEVARAEGDGWVSAVAWSPRGGALLVGTWLPCSSVELVSVHADGTGLAATSSFHEHTSGLRVLDFAKSADVAVSAGHDDTLRLYRVTDSDRALEQFASFDDNVLGVHDVSFSPEGARLLVAASHDDRLTLLDASNCGL